MSLLKKYDSDQSGSLDRVQLKVLLVDMVGEGHEVTDEEVSRAPGRKTREERNRHYEPSSPPCE